MTNKNNIKISLSLFTSFALFLSALSFVDINKKDVVAEAYNSDSLLPTTIDLNDTEENDIKNYYSSLNSLSNSERQGTNLLKNLKEILKTGQKYYSYDYNYGTGTKGILIWQMYEIIDRDWVKSPASSTVYGTYDSVNNRLVNYQYGTSNSNSKNNPYLHTLYVNRDVDNQSRAWGDHTQVGWGINREHIWAKSHGMGATAIETDSNSSGARGDPMHLWSGNGYINGADFHYHSNYFFGFVDLNKDYRDTSNDGSGYTYLSGNYEGTALNSGSYRKVFEPQDCDKGDIARAIFYMAARYNFLSGVDEDGIDENNPNLILVDREYDTNGNSSYNSSEYVAGEMGVLRDLLAWNRLDPPDEWEIHRNNLLYNNYTNNRNPFIDYPEWAEYIWGKPTLGTDNRTITAYNNSPTGVATPESDNISSFSAPIAPTSISLTSKVTDLEAGDTYQLEYEITPSNATDKRVVFNSSDTSVATVSDTGYITAIGSGETYISVTTFDGSYSDGFYLTVTKQSHDDDYYLTDGSPYINGVPYKMYFHHTLGSTEKDYYFTGQMSGYYGKSTSDITSACDIYFEENGAGQNMYFYSGSPAVKNYLYVSINGSYYNFAFDGSVPEKAWVYDSTYGFMTYTTNGKTCSFGSYNQYTNFAVVYTTNSTRNAIDFITSDDNDGALNSVTGLATIFMDYISCDSTGNTAPTYKTSASWSVFETLYLKYSEAAKELLANTDSSVSGTSLQQGLARYDYIIGKYNTSITTPFNDFLGRIEAKNITLGSFNANCIDIGTISSNELTIIIIAISSSLIAAFTLLLTIKKKRKIHH